MYTHLTQEERYHIYELRAMGKSMRQAAKELKRDQSTVAREIKRNKGARGYRPHQAHNLACERRRGCANGPRVAEQTWSAAQLMIKEKWSPKLTGFFKYEGCGWEMVYNPTTKEIWHLQPIKR